MATKVDKDSTKIVCFAQIRQLRAENPFFSEDDLWRLWMENYSPSAIGPYQGLLTFEEVKEIAQWTDPGWKPPKEFFERIQKESSKNHLS